MFVVSIAVVIAMVVAPGPVFFLFLGRKLSEVSAAVAMGFIGPSVVVNDFVIVPHVIIGVVRVVNPIGMVLSASDSG